MTETIQVSSEQFNAMLAELNLLHQAMQYAGAAGLESDDPGIFEIASNGTGEMLSLSEVQALISGLNAGEFDHQDGPKDGFYIIYETDAWSSWENTTIKAVVRGLEKATSLYWKLHPEYHPVRIWQLKMGFLNEDHEPTFDGNILRELADCTPHPKPE